jgi:uncharacterized protein (DUF2141 family)
VKFIGKIPFLIVAVLAWIVIISSCANQGMPTGGPLDSLPPVLINTQPKFKALNYKGSDVRFTFNEYINSSKISEMLVVSPPLEKRPVVLTKSKTIIVRFNEDLKDSTTYSLDFKDAIVDNNENNPFDNFRFSFSTGDNYDSLRVTGRVLNSFNLNPLENVLVMLHKNLHDSAVFALRPDFIAKTDKTGLFLIDNVPSGKYNLFAINDLNNDLKYNEGAEEIAYWDSLIVPYAEYIDMIDTVVSGADSFLVSGHTHFFPEPVFMRYFSENLFDQFLQSFTRSSKYRCDFIFNEPVNDTFEIRLVGQEAEDWYILEPNAGMDSITLWITDTILANNDTLLMELSYFQLDTANQVFVQKDTLALNFTAREDDTPQRRRRSREDEESDEEIPVPQFSLITNVGNVFELNSDIEITLPEPVFDFDTTAILLHLMDDSLKTPLDYSLTKDSLRYRTYHLAYKWESGTSYTLSIDSAAFTNIYGITSSKLARNFKTRDENYYGQIILNFSEVKTPLIVQLLRNDNKETIIKTQPITADGKVIFDYLAPEKYIVKIIYDDNNNGKWDSGSFQDKYQPERVAYHNEVIKVRSNWDSEIIWVISEKPEFVKNIIDAELEAQKKKEAEERAKKEQENQQQQINIMQGGGGTNIFR